jgi:thiol:disulfide interchange protein DsbD
MAVWFLGVASVAVSAAGDHVKPELLFGRTGYLPGRSLQAGIRLVMEPGWHCCWVNPGAGGAKLRAVWELPLGWRAGELDYPVPERFQAGGLTGFGYTGEVLLPVRIEVPQNASGEARIKLRLSWAACNRDGCVPESLEIPVVVPQGGGPTRDAIVISRATSKIPLGLYGARLVVRPVGSKWLISVRMPEGRELDLSKSEMFPVSTKMIDPAATVSFTRNRDGWVAEAPRSAQGRGSSRHLKLLFVGGSLPYPITVEGRVSG